MHRGSMNIPHIRLRLTYAVMAFILVFFVGRLFMLQILEGAYYQDLADKNRFITVRIPAPRGVIYDRNGFQLVRNVPTFNVMITPAFLPDSEAETEAIYRRISELTGVPVDQEGEVAAPCLSTQGIRQLVLIGETNRPYDAWHIACDVDENIARILREEQVDLPGVSVEAVANREYSTGDLTAAIIGYLGRIPESLREYYEDLGFVTDRDKIGYDGIEYWYQDLLAGQNGEKEVEVDVAGQQLREVGIVTQPVPGNSLRLTIDTRLQAAAETALINRMEFINRYAGEERTPIGVVIAMNPQTGEILAMVSWPTFENNLLTNIPQVYYFELEADERGKPLINHAIAGEWPPGSTFKMVTAVGALNEGVITPDRRLFDPGKITIYNRYFPKDQGKAKDFVCHVPEGHGWVDFVHGIAYSCNVYFYKIGGGYPGEVDQGLGIEGINLYAPSLGYGGPMGIDLPGEEDGLIPSPYWKRINLGENWSDGDTYNTVTGQGFVLATPLQVMTSIATLANGGKVMWPHLVQEVLDGEGNVIERYEPCVLWDIADGILTPLESIGASCPTLPDEIREIIQTSRQEIGTPDVLVEPWVIEQVQEGLHLVTQDGGTAYGYGNLETISSAGKTGTGEFCDEVAQEQGLCIPGQWPTHAWYVAYAPFENPEIVVAAFVYNGGEGAVTSGPIVRQVLEAYFSLKAIDVARTD